MGLAPASGRHSVGKPPRPRRLVAVVAASLGVWLAVAPARPAQAQVGSARYSSVVVDNATGKVLQATNADDPRFPASLAKLMTLYMVFEALRDHRISIDQLVPVSAHAASMEPSKLDLVPGTRMTVQDGIMGVVTKSANDAACALGELLGGTEERFSQMETLRARALGMSHTTFRNASGLPDVAQITTARDLAVLAHHLIQDFPDEYHYFSAPEFVFHRRVIPNHDRMLTSYDGADGLKTGYTEAAGHNLVTSAMRGGVRLIGVVMGAGSNPERDATMADLLDNGYEAMDVPITRQPQPRFRMPSLIASADASTLGGGLHLVGRHHGFRFSHLHHLTAQAASTRAAVHTVALKSQHRVGGHPTGCTVRHHKRACTLLARS